MDWSKVEPARVDKDPESESRNAIAYLQLTDWYVIRFMETGKEVPTDISEARSEARNRVLP